MKAEKEDRERVIALVSGGLDSTVALAMARGSYRVQTGLFFEYGQHAATSEYESAKAIARHYRLDLMRIDLPWFERVSHSALIRGRGEPPDAGDSSLDDASLSRAVWIENRNGVFVNIAAAVAASNGFSAIIAGFNAEEAEYFPDNSERFVENINACLALGTSNGVEVASPTIRMTKREIVREGLRLGIPWHMIWSCYRSGPVMCGSCESCRRLERAVEGTEAVELIRFEGEMR